MDYGVEDHDLELCKDSEDLKKVFYDHDAYLAGSVPKSMAIMQEDEDSIIVGIKYHDRLHLRKHKLGGEKNENRRIGENNRKV